MTLVQRCLAIVVVCAAADVPAAWAQDERHAFVGGVFGVSTLSADGRAATSAPDARVSLYKPENGPALNLYAGVHLTPFLTAQANYVWNRNDVTVFSSFLSPSGGGFYEQARTSRQHAVVGDLLLYFRRRGSGVRPYLSTGVGLVRFSSGAAGRTVESGAEAPAGEIETTRAALRVAVGIDLARGVRWAFRYSFSETISGNPISPRLTPPGERNLANFQNLFGFVARL